MGGATAQSGRPDCGQVAAMRPPLVGPAYSKCGAGIAVSRITTCTGAPPLSYRNVVVTLNCCDGAPSGTATRTRYVPPRTGIATAPGAGRVMKPA